MSENPIIWQPDEDRVRATAMFRFMREQGFENYDELFAWSIADLPAFWTAVCGFCDVRFDAPAKQVLARPDNIMNAGWFEGSKLNFAKHLLRHEGDKAAIIFCGENDSRREVSRNDLRAAVAAFAQGLRDAGVVKGDRVAGYLPNCPEAMIAMLATTSIGAVWSSCSPDFGVNGVVDRFGQIEPKVFVATNGYFYNTKRIDCLPVVQGIVAKIPSVTKTVIVPFLDDNPNASGRRFCGLGFLRRCGRRASVRGGRIQSPAVHPVFVGHDGSAEVHCSWSRRNTTQARERIDVAD